MPGSATHYLFGVDLYQSMKPNKLKKCIHNHIGAYRLGLQGPDLFFFDIRMALSHNSLKFGNLMHEHDTSSFFRNYLTAIRFLKKADQEIAISYLSGYLAHYTLDSSIHPYVYSRAGYNPNKKNSNVFAFETHGNLEAYIDKKLLVDKKHLLPSQFHTSKTVHLSFHEFQLLSKVLADCLTKTYFHRLHTKVSKFVLQKAFLSIKIGASVLHSHRGYRKKILTLIENVCFKYHVVSTVICTDQLTDSLDAFNVNHQEWKNPWNPDHTHTLSVYDLWNLAFENYQAVFPLLNSYITHYDDFVLNKLLQMIGNRSLHSGLDCDYVFSKPM